MPIRAVIFDLDGTITEPYLDFDAIREEIGVARESGPILEIMEKMSPEQRQRAEAILHSHEDKALAASKLNVGVRETLDELRRRGIQIGILTRNRKCNAVAIGERHHVQFDAIVGREDGPVKPDAFGVRHLCQCFGVQSAESLLVGDYLHDLLCARAAGAVPVLLANHPRAPEFAPHADFVIENLREILQIVDDKNSIEGTES
ncbi:MAG: HAD family hydrolase [Sedimentisphaerales bacterium]|nr:HAD family hydrolase [Sedimentisphaerales bacterium]